MVERAQDGYAWIQFRLEHKNQQREMLMMRWMGRMRSGRQALIGCLLVQFVLGLGTIPRIVVWLGFVGCFDFTIHG